jgi:D-lactate dehydrogenase
MGNRVYFYEAFAEEAEAIRRHLPAGLEAGFTWKTIQEAGDAEPPAPVVSIRTQSAIPTAWAGRLAGVLTRSTGYDHVRAWRRACGAAVAAGYLPSYCSRAVAEQAALLWMALLRRLRDQMRQYERFARDGLTGRECLGRTLLVVGVGRIGSQVARIGEGLGMNVLGVDIDPRFPNVRYVAIDEGLAAADVVVCTMSLTESNASYFSAPRLERVKSGAVFVNVARGELAPAAGLLAALKSGRLAGVGLDVYENEPALAVALRAGGQPPAGGAAAATWELTRRPEVIATPHNAFNTIEAVERKAAQSVESAIRFLDSGAFPDPVPQ